MTRKQWKVIIGINLLSILLVVSPFLPGPFFLSGLTIIIFSLAQLCSLLGLLLIPIGLLLTFKQMKKQDKNVFPILLWSVPILTFVFSIWGSDFTREISRTIAMDNADKLIIAIEKYKRNNNEYPNDISSLQPEYLKSIPKPWIMGISGYKYEKKGNNFNLTFTQNVIIGLNIEVVVYDPTEKHKAEGELETLYETGNEKWKYYIFD
jgi:hypothetical protein